jgi:hypothetical protein
MTDRENFGGGFFERWSRRKIEAEQQAPDAVPEQDATQAPDEKAGGEAPTPASDAQTPATESNKASATPGSKPKPDIKFDIASLPSLDSITAATDVRAFLSPGVPAELTRAALRRAWAADPAIRDFKGLAENDWDFTDPKAMAGFGDLPADFDVRKLVAQIMGEPGEVKEPAAAEPEPAPAASVQQSDPPREIASVADAEPAEAEYQAGAETTGLQAGEPPDADLVHRNSNVAMHNSIPTPEEEETKTRRTHGRALPQ